MIFLSQGEATNPHPFVAKCATETRGDLFRIVRAEGSKKIDIKRWSVVSP